jgi:hypothetical protein
MQLEVQVTLKAPPGAAEVDVEVRGKADSDIHTLGTLEPKREILLFLRGYLQP